MRIEDREVKSDERLGKMQNQLDGLERLINSSGKGPGLSAPVVSDRLPGEGRVYLQFNIH